MSVFTMDNNAFYHRLLLQRLPTPCHQVLDVGCGTGKFAGKLAERADHVDALDRSAEMIAAAETTVPGNVTCIQADILQTPLPDEHYDAIVSISAFHHLPLDEVLPRLARALRPGGVLAAIALPRAELPRDLPVEAAAITGQILLSAAFALPRAVGHPGWFRKRPENGMPILDPTLTTRQVRSQAEAALPGVRVRRLLFWRYLMQWRKPIAATPRRSKS